MIKYKHNSILYRTPTLSKAIYLIGEYDGSGWVEFYPVNEYNKGIFDSILTLEIPDNLVLIWTNSQTHRKLKNLKDYKLIITKQIEDTDILSGFEYKLFEKRLIHGAK